MKTKQLLASACIIAALAGCGKDDKEEVVQHLTHRGLMKTWEGSCTDFKLFDLSSRSYYDFDGNDFREVYELYSDDNCVNPVGFVRYTGNMSIGSEVRKDSDVYNVDYQYKNVELKVFTDEGAKLVDGFCGIDAMPVGEFVNVTNESGKIKCPTKRVPRTEYGVFSVKDEVLRFGEVPTLGGRPETPTERPQTLNPDSSYHPTDKDFD